MTVPMTLWWMGFAGFLIGLFQWKIANALIRYKCQVRGKTLPTLMVDKFTVGKVIGAVFSCLFWMFLSMLVENTLYAFFCGLILAIGVILTFVDAKIRIIPNEMLLLMLALSVTFHLLGADKQGFLNHLAGMIVSFFLLWLATLFGGRGKIGAGDVKLAGVIGFILGFYYAVVALFIMAIASFIGGLIGIYFYRLNWHSKIPMAGYLMGGLVIAMVLSQGMGIKIFGF